MTNDEPKIQARVQARESMRVLRNRLYQMSKLAQPYGDFLRHVSYVLNEGRNPLEFWFAGNEQRDTTLTVYVRIGRRDIQKEVSLLGSGTLQIIEVLLGVHEALSGISTAPRDLNLILLDEPDSHIHRDIQRRLVATLREQSKDCQLFLTTHNESLIRGADPAHLFHLQLGYTGVYRPIVHDPAQSQKLGLQPSRQIKILTSLGSESALDFLNALEARWLVLVEGEDDARYIQAIVEKQWLLAPTQPFSAMYWSFRGVDNLLLHIDAYRQVFSQMRNQQSLWDKSVLVFDADDLTPLQRDKVTKELADKLGIRVYIWPAYTLEAVALAEPGKLVALLCSFLRQQLGPQATFDEARVQMLVTEQLGSLVNKFRQKLNDTPHLIGVSERLRLKRDRLEALLGKPGAALIGRDDALQNEYRQACMALLEQGLVHHMAKKEDVAGVVRAVCAAFSAPFDEHRYFLQLIEASNPSTRFDSWTELTRILT